MAESKLHAVIAVEKQVKGEAEKALTKAYQGLAQEGRLTGLTQTYRPLDPENGEQFPDDIALVERTVQGEIAAFTPALVRLFDLVATKDQANRNAEAFLVLEDGTEMFGGRPVPAVTLLFLEDQLDRMLTFVSKLPVLEPSKEWTFDGNVGYYRAAAVQSHKTKKVPKVLTLAEATQHHPAQAQVYNEDVLVGYWTKTAFSGAVPAMRRTELVRRVESLLRSVKAARTRANEQGASNVAMGEEFFAHLFA